MLGVDSEIGTSALRLWVAAGSSAVLIVFCVLAFFRTSSVVPMNRSLRAGMIILPAVLGAAMTWAFLDRGNSDSRGADRRAFELRAEQLGVRALAPGSPLACLDGLAGESIETACEKALFASPATVAAASSYVTARLTLLASMSAYAKRGDTDIDDVISSLRRSLEADRFGFLAHALVVRDGCTSQNCKALAVLRDTSRVRTNLSVETLKRYIERYAAVWAAATDGPVADGAQPSSGAPHKMVNIDFPSAASIPAVSIMNPEPTGPVLPGAAAAAASNPNPQPATAHRAQKPAGNPATQRPVQPAAVGATVTEPIWPEPVPAGPSPLPASAPAAAAAPAAPMQLNPPSTGAPAATARAQ